MNKYEWNSSNKKAKLSSNEELLNNDEPSNTSNITIYSFSNHIYFNDDIYVQLILIILILVL